jgi:ferric-dicitrate binding protein FerR (iron transport regulator)
MDKDHYKNLVKRYLEKKSTDEELEVFFHLAEKGELDQYLSESMDEELGSPGKEEEGNKVKKLHPAKLWMPIAASVLILLSLGFYLLLNKQDVKQTNMQVANIPPGGNKAFLTLANGNKIILNSAKNGNIATQGNVTVLKVADGQLSYAAKGKEDTEAGFNTITTPKGGQYQLILADGTKVWLNAMSSLRFPAVFKGVERQVELTGEAYFEVAKNKAMPFIVKSGFQAVRVLGTHFDVNAYTDESSIKTTLLEGSVEVSNQYAKTIIAPGQQSVSGDQGGLLKREVDTEKEVAWKNGIFSFDGDDLKTIMRQVSRWYNVDVSYSGTISDEKFHGEISRFSNLSDVLKILELYQVHFEQKDNNLIVSYNPHSTND